MQESVLSERKGDGNANAGWMSLEVGTKERAIPPGGLSKGNIECHLRYCPDEIDR